MKELWDRVMAKVQKRPSGCWIWTGRKSRNGYGRISVRGTERQVHRVMYMLAGKTVFASEHIDHLCRKRACCNPDHLEAVTPRENTRRGLAGTGPRNTEGKFVRHG